MIKHEEVREIVLDIEQITYTESFFNEDDGYEYFEVPIFYEDDERFKAIKQYIAEQEKKDELLELYRNHHYHLMQGNIAPMLRIRDKIIALEEELK